VGRPIRDESDRGRHQRLTHDKPSDVRWLCAQRYAHANLTRTLHDGVQDEAENPDQR
jgi:hypothetical protein